MVSLATRPGFPENEAMKCAFLTCENLDGYVTDDRLLVDAFARLAPHLKIEWVAWDRPTDWNRFDFALIRTTWDYTQRLEEFLGVVAQIEKSSCRLINGAGIVRWNCRKTYLRDLLRKDIPVIPSLFLEGHDLASLTSALNGWPQEKVALKPVVGANSVDIRVLEKHEARQACAALLKTNPAGWFLQPFLPEIASGEMSYHYFGGEFSHAIRKTPKAGDFRVQEEHGGDIQKHAPTPRELRLADQTLKAVPEELFYARVDAIFHRDRWLLMELELIEPSLYFRMDEKSPENFVRAFLSRVLAP